MANEIKTKLGTLSTFSITLASLANGSARSSASIDNTSTLFEGALVTVELTSGGSAPTVNTVYTIYLLRDDADGTDPIRTDNWAGTDAAFTPLNAPILGTIVVTAATATEFRGQFDTRPLGALGPKWGIAIHNGTGQALSTTEADSFARYQGYLPEVQ